MRLKCRHEGDIRTVIVQPDHDFGQLKKRLSNDYGFEVSLKYEDSDKDMITLSSQNDFDDMFHLGIETINVQVTEAALLPNLQNRNRSNSITNSNRSSTSLFLINPNMSTTNMSNNIATGNTGTVQLQRIVSATNRLERFPSIDSSNSALFNYGQQLEVQFDRNIRWKRGEMLGQGAFGVVYLGLNIDSGELMAVKQMAIEEVSSRELSSLENEINLLRNLGHQNIVRYIGTEVTPSALSIFLEYAPGGSLKALIDKFGHLEEGVAKSYTRQLLLGLEYLHRNGIAHRDIKGANCLVGNDGVIKLADFGNSKQWRSTGKGSGGGHTQASGDLKGTPSWMAPEVIREQGGIISWKKADVWSLACTTLEMTTGKPPWSQFQNSVTILYHIACQDTLPEYPKGASVELLTFLNVCLQRDPSRRPDITSLLLHSFVANAGMPMQGGLRTAGGSDFSVRPSTVSTTPGGNWDVGRSWQQGSDSGKLRGEAPNCDATPAVSTSLESLCSSEVASYAPDIRGREGAAAAHMDPISDYEFGIYPIDDGATSCLESGLTPRVAMHSSSCIEQLRGPYTHDASLRADGGGPSEEPRVRRNVSLGSQFDPSPVTVDNDSDSMTNGSVAPPPEDLLQGGGGAAISMPPITYHSRQQAMRRNQSGKSKKTAPRSHSGGKSPSSSAKQLREATVAATSDLSDSSSGAPSPFIARKRKGPKSQSARPSRAVPMAASPFKPTMTADPLHPSQSIAEFAREEKLHRGGAVGAPYDSDEYARSNLISRDSNTDIDNDIYDDLEGSSLEGDLGSSFPAMSIDEDGSGKGAYDNSSRLIQPLLSKDLYHLASPIATGKLRGPARFGGPLSQLVDGDDLWKEGQCRASVSLLPSAEAIVQDPLPPWSGQLTLPRRVTDAARKAATSLEPSVAQQSLRRLQHAASANNLTLALATSLPGGPPDERQLKPSTSHAEKVSRQAQPPDREEGGRQSDEYFGATISLVGEPVTPSRRVAVVEEAGGRHVHISRVSDPPGLRDRDSCGWGDVSDATAVSGGDDDGCEVNFEQGYMCLDEHQGIVTKLRAPKRTDMLLSASTDGTVRLWDTNYSSSRAVFDANTFNVGSKDAGEGMAQRKVTLGKQTEAPDRPTHSARAVRVVNAWSEDQVESVWAACSDGTLRVWSGADARPLRFLKGHDDSITCLEGATGINGPQGACLVATGSVDKTVRIWDARAKRSQVFLFRGHADKVLDLKWGEGGRAVYSAGKDKSIKIWDTRAGRLRVTLEKHFSGVNCLRVLPEMLGSAVSQASHKEQLRVPGLSFASAGRDSMINLWTGSGICVGTVPAHRGSVGYLSEVNYNCALKPSSLGAPCVISAGADCCMKVWDLRRAKLLADVPVPLEFGTVTKAAWAGHGIVAVTSSGAVKAWDYPQDTGDGGSVARGAKAEAPPEQWTCRDLAQHSQPCTDLISNRFFVAAAAKSGQIFLWTTK